MNHIESIKPPVVGQGDVIAEFPCTQTQLRCWVLDQMEPGNPALNVAVRWEIQGVFRASSIEAAFRKIIERHEILRTRVVEVSGTPVQQVLQSVDFRMSVIDLQNLPADHRDEHIGKIASETASAPFDLAKAGLLRVTLLMLAKDRGILLITAHQSCFDGWSIRVLGREVGEIASAIDGGRSLEVPELPLQYGDYALWQQAYMDSYGFETEKTFWLEKLGDAPYFEVPGDHSRQARKTNRGNIISVAKPLDFGQRMEAASREHQVSMYSLGVAVVSALLHRHTGKRTILFGSQIAGRDDTDLENLIGVFINNLVMRIDFPGETSFAEHLRLASKSVEEAINHQKMPFNKLVEVINPPRDSARNPLISVNFNLQKAFLEDHRYGEFKLISAPSQSPGVIYDLNFLMVGRPSGWRMSLEYNSDLFEEETAQLLLRNWQAVYDAVLADSGIAISDLPLNSRETGDVARPAKASPQSRSLREEEASGETAEKVLAKSKVGLDKTESSATGAIAAIWREVLQVDTVRPDDDFFALGGHSLLALRMISQVRSELGVAPSLATLFKSPTLAQFVTECAVPEDVQPKIQSVCNPWRLITFRQGEKANVFTINHPFLYYRLTRELPESVGVHNINLFEAEIDDELAKLSFADFAEQAVDLITKHVRECPVAMVGLCINGNMAIEVSNLLRRRGLHVPFTGIIDTSSPEVGMLLTKAQSRRMRRKMRLRRASHFAGRALTGRMKPIAFLKQFKVTKKFMKIIGIKAGKETREEFLNGEITRLLVQASKSMPKVPELDRTVQMFCSRSSHSTLRDLAFGWKYRDGEARDIVELKGWHEDSLTSSGMRELARLLMMSLLEEA